MDGFQWDPNKAESNLDKHGIDFADVTSVFDDEMALSLEGADCSTEDRYITMGMDNLLRVVVVVYTYRGDDIRIISARLADPSERKQYEAKP